MSWYVHITRAQRWSDVEQQPIAREEWLAYVEKDGELRRVTPAEVEANKPFVKIDDAAWIEQRGDGTDRVLAWFGYHKGLVDVRNPHAETLQKMADIAERLKANVVDEEDNLLVDPGPPQPTWRKAAASPRKVGGGGGNRLPIAAIIGAAVIVIVLAVAGWLMLK